VALLEIAGLEVDGEVQNGLTKASLDLQCLRAYDLCSDGKESFISRWPGAMPSFTFVWSAFVRPLEAVECSPCTCPWSRSPNTDD
jgi:hypothetical protein